MKTRKRFAKKVRVTVSFWSGETESFHLPESLIGNLAPVIASAYRGGMLTIESRSAIVRSRHGCATFAERLASLTKDVSATFGRSYTTDGCAVCGCDNSGSGIISRQSPAT